LKRHGQAYQKAEDKEAFLDELALQQERKDLSAELKTYERRGKLENVPKHL
jgi:hypothetical protein